jgi:putative ABC transport system permease protein
VIRPGIRRLFGLPFGRRKAAWEGVDEELRLHLELRTEQLIRSGLSPAEARAEAERRFGPLAEARRELERAARQREGRVRWRQWLDALGQDARYSWRRLVRSPGFTAVAVITLGLGIGANSAIFSVVNTVLLRPLPYAESERLVRVFSLRSVPVEMSGPDFMDIREQAGVFEGLAAYDTEARTLTGAGDAERVAVGAVTPGFFEVLRVRPVLGRTFRLGEMEPGQERVAVLSHGFWLERFGGDHGVLGRTITLNGLEYEVVGVVPPAFDLPPGRALWVPIVNEGMFATSRRAVYLSVIGRLGAGVTLAEAEAEVSTIAARLEAAYPESNVGWGATVRPMRDVVVGDARAPLLVLLGAVALVLLIACANVANLLLARAAGREGEFSVRAALGAGKARLVRHLLTESVMLGALGGALGLLLAVLGTRALIALGPAGIPRLDEVAVDGTVLAFTAAAALLTGILFGLAPALQVARANLASSIREGGRGASGGRGNRLRSGLVVGQTALAVVLLIGAGLLLGSFARMMQVDPGFQSHGVLAFPLSLPEARYPEDAQVRDLYGRFLDRLEIVPGVRSADAVYPGLGGGGSFSIAFTVDGREPLPPGESQSMQTRVATAGYFSTAGIPVRRGRAFTEWDRADAPGVVVLNEAAVRRYFPDEDPLGQRITLGWTRDGVQVGGEVVGIVGDVRHFGLTAEPVPELYLPHDQVPVSVMNLVLRTAGDPLAVVGPVRAALRELDPSLAAGTFVPLEDQLSRSVAQPRFYALLLGLFAAVALTLAAVGILGVMSYLVAQRTREIGIRMALGADARAVHRLVIGRGMLLTLAGLALGIPATFALTRVIESQLYGVEPGDPATLAAVVVLLTAVAFLSSYIPSRRATRIDPMMALRGEAGPP